MTVRLVGLVLVAGAATTVQAQFALKSSVLDGSGSTSSGGGMTNLSAAGQPGGIAESSGGGFVNQAGFLHTFFMRPGLDTDGDGLSAGQESVAGTDPNDPNALLEITSLTNAAGNRFVAWTARSNKTYRLLQAKDAGSTPTNVVAVTTPNGPASPPWYVLTASIADAFPATNASTYAVEVLP